MAPYSLLPWGMQYKEGFDKCCSKGLAAAFTKEDSKLFGDRAGGREFKKLQQIQETMI